MFTIKKNLSELVGRITSRFHQNSPKIFYTSLQRCGTKSFGKFFRLNGYNVASWAQTAQHGWMIQALDGRIQDVVRSEEFHQFQVFEDGPWFDIGIIKYIYSVCPESRFVYFYRPVEDWFQSMLSLNGGLIIGDPKRHCIIYNRLDEYYDEKRRRDKVLSMIGEFDHYKKEFENHALQIKAFFEDKPAHRFFYGELYDLDKWRKLETQWRLALTCQDDVHIHRSVKHMGKRDVERSGVEEVCREFQRYSKQVPSNAEDNGTDVIICDNIISAITRIRGQYGADAAIHALCQGFELCPEHFLFRDNPPAKQTDAIAQFISDGKFAEARALALDVVLSFGITFRTLYQLGSGLFRENLHDDAIKVFTQALKANPEAFFVRLFSAISCLQLGRHEDAFRHYLVCLRVDLMNKQLENQAIISAITRSMDSPVVHEILQLLEEKRHVSKVVQRILQIIYCDTGNLSALYANQMEGDEDKLEMRNPITVKEWVEHHGGRYQAVACKERITVSGKGQKGWDGVVKFLDSNEPYLANLDDVFVHGGSDLIFDRNNFVISDNLGHPEFGRFVDLKADPAAISQNLEGTVLAHCRVHADEVLDAGFLLAGASTKAFGHWFAEYAPKLYCLAQCRELEELPIIVDNDMPQQHYDFLGALVPNPIKRVERGQRVDVRSLWVAPTTTFRACFLKPGHTVPRIQQGALSARVLNFFRERVSDRVECLGGETPERIYLCRGNTVWRRLENEDEIVEMLKIEGVQPVCLGDLSFIEQVRLMRGAKQIIGPNGSSFNNLIYADPSVKVLILQSSSYDWSTGLGSLLDLGYRPEFIDDGPIDLLQAKHRKFEIDAASLLKRVRSQAADVSLVATHSTELR